MDTNSLVKAGPSKNSYPWELDWGSDENPVEHFWTTDLRSSPRALWPLLADTSSLNAKLGLPRMNFEERGGQLHGVSGKFLTRQEWIEVPWEWEVERSLTAERCYSKGFARRVRVRYLLSDQWGGTRLTIYFGWIPRKLWHRPLIRKVNQWLEKRYAPILIELDQLAAVDKIKLSSLSLNQPIDVDEARLCKGVAQLIDKETSSTEANRLGDYIRTASDQELFRMRPKILAFEWGMELDEVLTLLLQATKSGLLSISWDLICPHCQGVRKESRSLGELREFGHCDVCAIDFSATTQESIEVVFKVLPEVRDVQEVFYCSAEPAKKPHIVLQRRLAPRDSYKTTLNLSEGGYRIRPAKGGAASAYLEVVNAGGSGDIVWSSLETTIDAPSLVETDVRLVLKNENKESIDVVLERMASDPSALRPSELFNFQQFRDLFSEESIASGLKLEVGHQTLLFTDIVGSTQLYSLLGDTKAFNAVHSHFVKLQDLVSAHKGVVVKTIGDAMMAAFRTPQDALDVAVGIQKEFRPGDKDISLRVSVHRGLCLAVRLDANIDYFGNTVNFAAKMQSVAEAGDVVLSEEFHKLPGIAQRAEKLGLVTCEEVLRAGFDHFKVLLGRLSE